jgi:hypothetical protein
MDGAWLHWGEESMKRRKRLRRNGFTYWKEGEVVVLEPGRHLYLECCDCGLTHKITAKVDGKTVVLDCERVD